jgi:hypothetical protein
MKHWLLVFGVIFILCKQAFATDLTGARLLSFCQGSASKELCSIYIAGVNDGFFGAQTLAQQGRVSCILPIDGHQAVMIVEKYMREHPDELHEAADILVVAALISTFPCKKPN